MKWLDKQALEQMSDYCLLDVRTEKQYRDGHLPNAINLPIVAEKLHYQLYHTYHTKGKCWVIIESLPHFRDFLRYFQQLYHLAQTEQTIIIYCSRARFRSKLAYTIVRCFHRSTFILAGGIKGMSAKKFEALCPECGIEHLFNEVEVQHMSTTIHCKKCGRLIPMYLSEK
ncbi:MAG: rhodanese-like domain-containing protein [Culicoidibacterales bacterium]